MTRWILVLAALLLGGCATTRPYYYDDGYYGAGERAYAGRYDDGYHGDRYLGSRHGVGGDYWYGADARDPGYFHTPYYYSLFWPLNRWAYDPYWYPGYHYGVTWFPRNYFGLGLSWSSGWSHWGHFAYSPYRWGWSDWYYDWRPWYRHYPRYAQYYARPRFGDPHHEAERLAALARTGPRRHASTAGGVRGHGTSAHPGLAGREGPLRRGAAPAPRRAAAALPRPRAAAGPRQRDVEPGSLPRPRDRGAAIQAHPWGEPGGRASRAEGVGSLQARQPLPRGAVGLRQREWAGAAPARQPAGVPWQGSRGDEREAMREPRGMPRALPRDRDVPRDVLYGGREPVRVPRDTGWRSAPAGPPPGYAPAPQRYAPSASYQPPPRSEPEVFERPAPAASHDSPSRSFQPPARSHGGPRRGRRGDEP